MERKGKKSIVDRWKVSDETFRNRCKYQNRGTVEAETDRELVFLEDMCLENLN